MKSDRRQLGHSGNNEIVCFRIAKPRLVRFPDVHDPQSEAKTKQILSEIDRINEQLGYVRKQPRQPQLNRPPVESYFFPRDRRHFTPASSWHGSHQYHVQPPVMQSYLIVPLPFEYPSPSEYSEVPQRQARKFSDFSKMDFYRSLYNSPYNKIEEKQMDLESIEPPLITFPHASFRNNFTFSLPPIVGTPSTTTAKPKDKDPDLIDAIIDEVVDDDEDDEDNTSEDDDDDDEDDYDDENQTKRTDTQNVHINKYINNLYKNSVVVPKQPLTPNKTTTVLSLLGPSDNSPASTAFISTTEKTRIFNPLKRIKDFNKRKQQQKEAYLQQEQQHQNQQQQENSEKSPFGFFRPAEAALKEGGIVIQRLRVRQGGISIAGAGGVATSGSGGTSIVGPGGIALSHPRSLSVVGPGARVVSVPANIDLGEIVSQITKGRSLPYIEGAKVVATGPAIYYNTGMR